MKKLGKLSLKEMESEMLLLKHHAQEKLFGGYENDCFWRCVSYMEGAGGNEASAEWYANQYYNYGMGCSGSADAYYYQYGAGVVTSDIQSYTSYRASSGTYNYSDISGPGYIGTFNTANGVGNYANTGTAHAVVITCINSDGSAEYYDPQLGEYGTFSASDMANVTRVMY
jgi:hypothetical protein